MPETPCPLVGEIIPGLGITFGSNQLKYVLNTWIIPAINGMGSGSSALDLTITGPGRVVGPEYLSGDPNKPTTTTPNTLAIRFKPGTYLAADADGVPRKVVLTAFLDSEELAPGLTDKYPHYRAVKPEDSDDYILEWHPTAPGSTPNAALLAAGFPCIGKVTTGADTVTALDLTKESRVYTNALFQAIIGGLAPGEGGEALDLSDYATLEYVDGLNEQRLADIEALKLQNTPWPPPFDTMNNDLAAVKVELSKVNPSSVEVTPSAIVSGMAGHGQNDTPDFTPDTGAPNELVYNALQGWFE